MNPKALETEEILRKMNQDSNYKSTIEETVKRARSAMESISNYDQKQIDQLVKAVAWSLYEPKRARELAEIAVEDTKLGNVEDKVIKNQRKTLGTLDDLLKVKTVGVVSEDLQAGIVEYAKPVGVVGTLTPSTNPAATPVNQAMMAIKGGNAIVVSPSPTGLRTARMLEKNIHFELQKLDAPLALFKVLPGPVSLEKAEYLMKLVDLVLVTGDQANVRKGYSSGTPCIGVGKGNVPVIVDKSANLKDAAKKIAQSKTFDNATSCSSENAIIVDEKVYEDFLHEMLKVGAVFVPANSADAIQNSIFPGGQINRQIIGKPIKHVADLVGLNVPSDARFILVEQQAIGPEHPLSGEKLSLIVSLYKSSNFSDAIEITNEILSYEGIGHSVGIHCNDEKLARDLASHAKVARVLVNQAHTFGNGGGFNNSLPFTLSMGCGTWAGNSISENLSIKNFVNTTKLVFPIDERAIDPAQLFASFD